MTKKHFIALADAIKAHTYNDTTVSHEFTEGQLQVLADFCAASNPNFNRRAKRRKVGQEIT